MNTTDTAAREALLAAKEWLTESNSPRALRDQIAAALATTPQTDGAPDVRNALVSLECTRQWLEGGCDPKAAAVEIQGIMRMLQGVEPLVSQTDGAIAQSACPQCGGSQATWKCTCDPMWSGYANPAAEISPIVGTQPPFANCRFKFCDLPGQCRDEGKCHHPAIPAATDGATVALTVLDKPAQVNHTVFRTGVSWATVIGAAQRHYAYRHDASIPKPYPDRYNIREIDGLKLCGIDQSDRQFVDYRDYAALQRELAATHAPAMAEDSIARLVAFHADQLEANPYCYFELAYTRQTDWMAWITDRPAQGEPGTAAYAKSRKVIVRGQGSTAQEACADALAAIAAASGGEQG